MRPGTRLPVSVAILTLTTAGWLGCGGGGSDIAAPDVGTLDIVAVTSGPEPDTDGYTVSVDGTEPAALGSNATLRRVGLPVGQHTVDLSGIASNCSVTGGTRQTVSITPDAVTVASYAVACAPTTGAIEVTTTTGTPADPDGYVLVLDGAEIQPIATAATVTLEGIAPGPHTVGVAGLATTCSVDGDNPEDVTVAAGATSQVAISVTCTPPPPDAGTLRITTATNGSDQDPDGYAVSLDGGASQPIGRSATLVLASIAAGPHAVRLLGVAGNCTVEDGAERSVELAAAATVEVAFTVTCTDGPPSTGTLEITTTTSGPSPDPDGYRYRIDGGAAQPIGVNATVSVDGLAPGTHTLRLVNVAGNCDAGENPREFTVPAGGTAEVAWAVACGATTGSLTITTTTTGSPADPDGYTVSVDGGTARPVGVSESITIEGLEPGTREVRLAGVAGNCSVQGRNPRDAEISAGATAEVAFAVTCSAGSLNLRIDGWHLTQSVQSADGDVPMVNNRDGYLRVFVVANQPNTAAPGVRVRIFRSGTEARTLSITAPGSSVPTGRDEGRLGSSWNVKIPRELIGPGFAVMAEVDPENTIPETDEDDNAWPRSGMPEAPRVRSVPVLGVRFVPVRQNGLQGDVSNANRSQYLEMVRRIFPVAGADGDVHAVYTAGTPDPLQPEDANGAWVTILRELDALRVVEGSDRTYYGVVRPGYFGRPAGIGFIGLPTAMGYDDVSDRSRIMAHELGHTWGRDHAPCGGAAEPDPTYPYSGGIIGVFGVDMQNEVLKGPTTPDIMGYCGNPWISDYTYEAVLDYRAEEAASLRMAAAGPQRSLLVWGRIVDGRPVLEPAFEVVTRPSLPNEPGPYTVEALATDGARLFSISFDAAPVAGDPRGSRHFAFAVPLDERAAARLGSLRLTGPAGAASAVRAAEPGAALRAADSVVVAGTPGRVTLRWDARATPMLMVRDAATGEVLSFARGGQVEVAGDPGALEVIAPVVR